MNEIKELKEKVKAIYDEICEIEKREERSGKENKPEIEEVLKSESAENYIIGNSYMDNDYDKGLYLKMLGAVIHSGEVNKEEAFLFERIVKGISPDVDVNYYYKQAMQISRGDFEDFRNEFQNNKLKYRFIVDALVLTAVGGCNEEAIKFTAGIMGLLNINVREGEYLSALVKSILCQSSDMYDKAERIRPEKIDCMLFIDYTGNYRTVLSDNESEFNAGLPQKKKIDISEILNIDNDDYYSFFNKKVCLKNLIIDVRVQSIGFFKNDYVEITGCEFLNGEVSLYFSKCKKVLFKGCSFKDFTYRTMWMDCVNEVLIEDCLFENCEYNYDANRNDRGGVISGNNSNNIVIRSSKFIKCGIRNRSSYDPRCAISNLYNIIVENCYFEKCMAYYDETVKHTDAKLFVYNCSNINNKIVDSLDF